MSRFTIRRTVLSVLVAAAACVSLPAFASKEKPVIGFSIDDLRVERWARDRDFFIEAAKKLGLTISCDLNYRKTLWQYGKSAQDVMGPMLEKCDVLFGTGGEYKVAFGVEPVSYKVQSADEAIDLTKHEEFFKQVQTKAPNCKKAFIALRNTLSANHHIFSGLLYADGKLRQARTHAIDHVVDSVGAGDAFAAGMIYGLISYPGDDQSALEFATAAAVLKNTIYGDFNLVSADEVKTLMKSTGSENIAR
mgnify:CR=1 FL=1